MKKDSNKSNAHQNLKVWEAIKAKYPCGMVFIRIGQKYFTYGNDAVTFNQLTFAKITTDQQKIQKTFFSFERLNMVLSSLVKSGCKVVLCDKLES